MSRFPPWDQGDEKKAWDEGFDYGWSSGWEQGLRLTMNEVARRMINDDVPMSYIMKYTGLSDEWHSRLSPFPQIQAVDLGPCRWLEIYFPVCYTAGR